MARPIFLALLCLVYGSHWSTMATAQGGTSPVVDLGYSKYQGRLIPATNNTRFLGIRYAAPPVGPLRFSAPQAPAKVEGIQPADTVPLRCMQAASGRAPSTPFRSDKEKRQNEGTSEDCLFLNVYVPGKLQSSKRLPVVVWIHGGGYLGGGAVDSSTSDIQNGDDLVRAANGGVIAVTIQYRLGLFGFLPGKKVKQGGALNAGLLDQDFALRWVHKHISRFGGDPAKVTIWGESAGAGSVLQQVIANGGKTTPQLFRGAITSSSFLPSQYAYDDVIPETLYSQAVAQTNCTSAQNTLNCLRTVDVNTLEAVNRNINNSGFFGTFVFVPVVDGTFIRQRATQALKAGKVNGLALYSVTNTNEGEAFVDAGTADSVQTPSYIANLFPRLSLAKAKEGAAHYAGLGTPLQQVTAVMAEAIFVCPTYFILNGFRKGPTFKGEFAIPPGGHGNDVVYYFPSIVGGAPPYNNPEFIVAFAGSFLAFVKSLDPNNHIDPSNITPVWPTWKPSSRSEMLFNRTEQLEPVVHTVRTSRDLLARCEFWESVGAQTGQ